MVCITLLLDIARSVKEAYHNIIVLLPIILHEIGVAEKDANIRFRL